MHHKLMPTLDWIQVEVCSDCRNSCIYCPHTIYADGWKSRNMSPGTFERLLPVLEKVKLVHLQGWGEPFLNPHIFTMLKMAKDRGCRVGTTTGGMLFDDAKIEKLIKYGIDLLAFSLAGTGKVNDRIRCGTDLHFVLKVIADINLKKKKLKSSFPKIHIAYMLLRSGLVDLAKLPELLKDLGIEQVVITTLDFVADDSMQDEAVIPKDTAEFEEINSLLKSTKAKASEYGIELFYYITHPHIRNTFCTENIRRALFVSVDGEVSPCVFLNIPATHAYYRINDQNHAYQAMTFGNINRQNLATIWRRNEYVDFRGSFELGRHPDFCKNCRKLRIWEG